MLPLTLYLPVDENLLAAEALVPEEYCFPSPFHTTEFPAVTVGVVMVMAELVFSVVTHVSPSSKE